MNSFKEQFTDATGRFGENAKREGVLFQKEQQPLHSPQFSEIKKALKIETSEALLSLAAHQIDGLRSVPNARVMVGIKTKKGAAFLPSIVLPDSSRYGLRFGSLQAPEDIRKTDMQDASRPLSDFQQLLLAKISAEHLPDTGKHEKTGQMNGGEIGHAVVALSLPSPDGIHNQVHSLVDSKSLSASLAKSGVTDMVVNGRPRVNRELIVTPQQIAGVLISKSHQLPFPIQDSFEVSAGFTYIAQESQGKSIDLARNLSGMASV